MGGEADDRVGAEGGAGFGDGEVVLADVEAVGVAGVGELGVVVDDEQGAVGVGDAAEGGAGALDLAAGEGLLAELDDVGAAVEGGAEEGLGVGAVGAGVADEVKAGGAEALAAQWASAI